MAKIHAALMKSIREGRILPGAQLPNERKLAERFGASRQQVRDALLILNESGLISRRVGSGTWLSENAAQIIERLDVEIEAREDREHSFPEMIEARLIFEPGVAGLAARHVTESHIEAMRAGLEAVLEPANWIEFKARTYRFSRSYYVASGNSFLLHTFDQIVRARAGRTYDGHRENAEVAGIVRHHAYEQLAQIFRAIADGDEPRAESVTRKYLTGIAASAGLG